MDNRRRPRHLAPIRNSLGAAGTRESVAASNSYLAKKTLAVTVPATSRVSRQTQHGGVSINVKSSQGPAASPVIVYDDSGNDVTPISLVALLKAHKSAQGIDMSASGVKESAAEVLNNLESMSTASWSNSGFGKGQISFSSSSSKSSDDDDNSSVTSNDSDGEKESEGNTFKSKNVFHFTSRYSKPEVDVNKFIHFSLSETETIVLFDLASRAVSNDYLDELAHVKDQNARYAQQCQNRPSNDMLADRGAQTYGFSHKNKDVQVNGPTFSTGECQATSWEIYDATHTDADKRMDSREDESNKAVHSSSDAITTLLSDTTTSARQSNDLNSTTIGLSSRTKFSTDDGISESGFSIVGMTHFGSENVVEKLLEVEKDSAGISSFNQNNLQNSLLVMERAILANNYEPKQMLYRQMSKLNISGYMASLASLHGTDYNDEDDLEDSILELKTTQKIFSLNHLWSYKCELTRGRKIMYMAWNKQNEDVLAVAYGETEFLSSPVKGLLLCWSIKNPEWPERVYKSYEIVTAIDFSKNSPNLLAVGYGDGKISIFDVRRKDDLPVLDNSDIAGKHRDPIWELKWVERDHGVAEDHSKGEMLVSISTDGRVAQWQIRKGFDYVTDLMSLKRIMKENDRSNAGNNSTNGKSTGSFIARYSGGLCFDFNTRDNNTYIVGTEDGHIHRCSVSYNEQYLQSQFGHTGPVYKVRWSPFNPDLYLSCSADWTVRLWRAEEDIEILKFQGGMDEITDIAWSPLYSTIFGCVASDGRLEIWDLSHSVLDPIIQHSILDRHLTSIVFTPQASCVLVGDDNGAVGVYSLPSLQDEATNEKYKGLDQGALLEHVLQNGVGNENAVSSA